MVADTTYDFPMSFSGAAHVPLFHRRLPKIAAWVKENGNDVMIPYSVQMEQEIFEMPDDEKEKWLKVKGVLLHSKLHLLHFVC